MERICSSWELKGKNLLLLGFKRNEFAVHTFSTIFYKTTFVASFLFSFTPSPSEKGSTVKEKNLLPWGANSFLLEFTHFQKGGKLPWKCSHSHCAKAEVYYNENFMFRKHQIYYSIFVFWHKYRHSDLQGPGNVDLYSPLLGWALAMEQNGWSSSSVLVECPEIWKKIEVYCLQMSNLITLSIM